jgi:anti-sigma regulatory factor (Ser/Thr protein kinase)
VDEVTGLSSDPVSTEDVGWYLIEHDSAIGGVRRAAQGLATRLGFHPTRAAEIGLAITEAAGNQMKHAGGGTILLRACRSERGPGLSFVAIDAGPGIADVDAALVDGRSSAGTLGIGLGAIARLANSLDIHSAPGRGTVLSAEFGICDSPGPVRTAGLTRPMSGQDVCGDAHAARVDGLAVTVVLADGLGHGPLAAAASGAVVRAVLDAPFGPPPALLLAADRAARGTRGAAVAIAQFVDGEVRYAGIGNISGYLLGHGPRRGMISHAGIVGVNARPPRENRYPVEPGTVAVLHSDGVSDRAAIDPGAGLLRRSPIVVAAAVLREHGVRNDDACVVVVGPVAP